MDDDSDDKDTKRKSRNLSEKKRRDQFNLLVNELSSMVSTSGRKMDKSTVLKATISFLRNHNEIAMRSRIHEIQEDWKPSFLTNEEFTHLVLEAVDGFIIVFSTSGQIFYISESITSLLGHLPNELLTLTIYDLVWEEEHNTLYNSLFNPAEEKGQVCFSCHLRRGSATSKEGCTYELIHFVGYIRSDAESVQENRYSGYSGEADTRLVFVGIGRLQTPQLIREMSLVDSSKSEFTSRHSLEWKFLFLDHRAPPIIGYLPFELLGTSGYDYYHVDDLEKVVSCHEALMQKGEGMSCYYRFLTKGQQWIWLQTRFYITYHQWNSKPEFIVCTHRVVSYVDVLKHNQKETGLEVLTRNSPISATSSVSATWGSRSIKRRYSQEEPSDCTSMSADSPASRLSGVIQQPLRSSASQGKSPSISNHSSERISSMEQQPLLQPPTSQKLKQATSFLDSTQPTQFVTNISVQPVMGNFSPSAVLAHLPPVEMTPAQSQLQADLQRKHAELQALIGQQQAELRKVSEQLLMARLGLLPAQEQPSVSHTQQAGCHCQYNMGLMSNSVTGSTGIQLSSQLTVPTPGSDPGSGSLIPPPSPLIESSLQHQMQGLAVPCTGVPVAVPVPLTVPVSDSIPPNGNEVLTPLVSVHSVNSTVPPSEHHQHRTVLYSPPDSNSPHK